MSNVEEPKNESNESETARDINVHMAKIAEQAERYDGFFFFFLNFFIRNDKLYETSSNVKS